MNKGLVLVVLVAVGAAFGAGYVLGSGGSTPVRIEPDLDGLEVRGDLAEPEAPIRLGTARPELTTDETLLALRAAVATFPEPRPERGDGEIAGTVVTATGEPLAGVEISANPKRAGPRYQQPDDPDEALLYRLRWSVESTLWRRANKVTTTSDEAGHFRLAGLKDREHQISAWLEGWRIRDRDPTVPRTATPGARVDFVATAISGLTLAVYLPDGTQPKSASTMLSSAGGSSGGWWAPERPTIEAQPGTYQLSVTSGEQEEFQAGPLSVEIRAGETRAVRVDLEARPTLQVTVRFPVGEEAGGRVFVLRIASPTAPQPAVLRSRGESSDVRRRGLEAWEATHANLQAGTYAVGYTRGREREFDVIDVVEVGPGVTEHVLPVPPLDKDEYVLVRVRGPDGRGLPDARISTGYFAENASSSGSSPLVNRGDGEYQVLHHVNPWGKRPGGTWWVSAQAGGFGTQRVEYEPGSVSTIDLDFQLPASLEVLVENAAGTDYESRVRVKLVQGHHHVADTVCDAKGKAFLDGLQPGAYEIQLRIGERHFMAWVHAQPLALESGKNRLTLSLPTLYTVTVRGVDGTAWLRRAQEGLGSRFQKHATAADGEAVFDGLPAGTYHVRCGEAKATFRVPGPSVVVLEKSE